MQKRTLTRRIGGMSFVTQLAGSIDSRLEVLNSEIDALTRAREELTSVAPVVAATKPKRERAKRRRTATRNSAGGRPTAEMIQKALSGNPGLTTAAISEQTKVRADQLLPLLRRMEVDGMVRRSGQRRGTKWHPMADEAEWIAHRTAELANRSRRRRAPST
jgi:hypothetical protein